VTLLYVAYINNDVDDVARTCLTETTANKRDSFQTHALRRCLAGSCRAPRVAVAYRTFAITGGFQCQNLRSSPHQSILPSIQKSSVNTRARSTDLLDCCRQIIRRMENWYAARALMVFFVATAFIAQNNAFGDLAQTNNQVCCLRNYNYTHSCTFPNLAATTVRLKFSKINTYENMHA